MKLRFNREEVSDALAAICNVTSIRTPKDVLKCVHLEAKSDVLLLAATDLEIGLRCAATQVDVETPGTTLVVADTLARIVRECNDDLLQIELKDGTLHIRGQGSHFKIVTQAAEDFPPVPAIKGDPDFTIEHAELHRLIEWTLFAAARESTRFAINGVLWELRGDRLTLVATDGRRLSIGTVNVAGSGKKPETDRAIVPLKTLSLFNRLSASGETSVGVKLTPNQLQLKMGGSSISSALVEGHFPKYQDVIPSDCTREVRLNTNEFHGALKKAALLTNEESKGVRLSFGDGSLTLSSRAPEQGEATIAMPVEYQGEPMDIGFNPVFLTDVLRVAHADEVTFAFKEPNRPGMIRLNEDFLHVVMPVNIASG